MHETKICELCQAQFECKVGDILNCQCSLVNLNEEEAHLLAEKYKDCLCIDCLKKIKKDLDGKKLYFRDSF